MTGEQRARFAGLTAVVTGAAGGIGRRTAAMLLEEGAAVALADVDEQRVEAVAAELADGTGGKAIGVRCDVTRADSVSALFDRVASGVGAVDVLVNNAGVSTLSPIAELSERDWDLVMDVSAKGTFLCCRAAIAAMLERRTGTIVNVASQEGKRGSAGIAHYCAAKAAVINFTRALALEVAPHVRANSVCPGLIETDMVLGEWEQMAAERGTSVAPIRTEEIARIPLGRLQTVDDVASTVCFLASDAAAQITGASIDVNGGSLMA